MLIYGMTITFSSIGNETETNSSTLANGNKAETNTGTVGFAGEICMNQMLIFTND
jgi:hypothetical protein